MATGTIEFVAPVKGLRFDTVEVSNPHQAIEKITLKAPQGDQQVNVVFYLTGIFDLEEALGIAEDILPSIINGLAFCTNRPIGEPRFSRGELPKDASGSSYEAIENLPGLEVTAKLTDLSLGDDEREELATFLEQPYTSDYLYYLTAYRFAIDQDDPVARFMFLYNVLLQLNNDEQKQVDAFVRSVMPGVPQSQDPRSPNSPNKQETIYTRLRNEVAHAREYPPGWQQPTQEDTRQDIRDNMDSFQKLVHRAILEGQL